MPFSFVVRQDDVILVQSENQGRVLRVRYSGLHSNSFHFCLHFFHTMCRCLGVLSLLSQQFFAFSSNGHAFSEGFFQDRNSLVLFLQLALWKNGIAIVLKQSQTI